ncbi:MAG: OadG family protein [Desulfobacterales bacterium]
MYGYGFEAISAQNGWAMAITGILIVMAGLGFLSFVISQLHKVAALLENGFKKKSGQAAGIPNTPVPAAVSMTPHLDLAEAGKRLAPLAAELGESFELQHLYELANSNALPHVHLSIRGLRDSGVILPVGDGRFVWP